jgi:glutamate-1-semialdehyde-2,1-aminomutase
VRYERSELLYEESIKYLPGGVNSPVRAFYSVDMPPIFAVRGEGAKIQDEDGNVYIDYVCSWGPLILGHSSKVSLDGVFEVINAGTTFGMPTAIEIELAKEIVNAYKPMELVRMVNSGTEATMSAIRVARGYTGRDKIMKFEGCYHGHSDGLLVKSGSGTLTSGVPTSEGVPQGIIDNTLVSEFNNLEHVRMLFQSLEGEIAAIIVEPIPGNMGLVEAHPGFLQGLRELCNQYGSLLIFDEVISGFRIAYSGAQDYYKVEPDMVCLGKIIGGGMPVGAYGGRKEIMEKVAPLGGVYQAGTLSGNPLAMKMGLNVIRHLKENPEIYKELETKARMLEDGFNKNLQSLDIRNVTINRVGSMLCQFFTSGPVDSYKAVMMSNTEQYAQYFRNMLQEGILLPPAQYECMFLSTEHSEELLSDTIRAHYRSMKKVKELYS